VYGEAPFAEMHHFIARPSKAKILSEKGVPPES